MCPSLRSTGTAYSEARDLPDHYLSPTTHPMTYLCHRRPTTPAEALLQTLSKQERNVPEVLAKAMLDEFDKVEFF